MKRQILSHRFERVHAAEIELSLPDWQCEKAQAFKRRIEQGDFTFQSAPCPCRSNADVVVAEVDRYGLPLSNVLCEKCGTLRIDPYLDAASLEKFYCEAYLGLYGWAPVVEDYFSRQTSYGARIEALYKSELPRSADILEVGCGAGGALGVFQKAGYRVAGCDLSNDLIAHGTKSGIRDLWQGTASEFPEALACRRFDLIYLHHVFEHLPAARETLHSLAARLKANGRILVIVPDVTRVNEFAIPAGDVLQLLHVAHV
jgi:hypothetical protein